MFGSDMLGSIFGFGAPANPLDTANGIYASDGGDLTQEMQLYNLQMQQYDANRNAVLGSLNSIGSFIQSQRNASAMSAYYAAAEAAQQTARENVDKVAQYQVSANTVAANIQADTLQQDSRYSIDNAINIQNAALSDVMRGNRVAAYAMGRATQSFAAAGFAPTGSGSIVINDVGMQNFRDISNNYAQSMNNVNQYIQQAGQQSFQAAATRYSSAVQNQFTLLNAEVQTGTSGLI